MLGGNVLDSVLVVSLLATEAQSLSDGLWRIDLLVVSDLLLPLPYDLDPPLIIKGAGHMARLLDKIPRIT